MQKPRKITSSGSSIRTVPVHADAVMVDEFDAHANVRGSKGVGELAICGAGAAVANAVYNACGVRVRDYPITPDKVLAGLGAANLSV